MSGAIEHEKATVQQLLFTAVLYGVQQLFRRRCRHHDECWGVNGFASKSETLHFWPDNAHVEFLVSNRLEKCGMQKASNK